MLSDNAFRRLITGMASEPAALELEQALYGPRYGDTYFVNADGGYTGPDARGAGSNQNSGRSPRDPFLTMAKALSVVKTGDTIAFWGDIREELVGSNLVFDLSIIGLGALHHPDSPDTGYRTGGAMIRPPASPTATTSTLEVRGRGWKFVNIAFDCPVDAAAVKLVSNASSGTSEYDASHASFIGCDFQQGYRGIQDDGGLVHVTIDDCVFRMITVTGGAAIVNTSTSVRVPQFWRIRNSYFPGNSQSGGNECHIDAPLSGSLITGSHFGIVEGTALYIDLTGGDDNIVTGNYLAGSYDTSDYVAGTNDGWSGNITADISGNSSVDASGITIAVPGAP